MTDFILITIQASEETCLLVETDIDTFFTNQLSQPFELQARAGYESSSKSYAD